MSEEIKSITKKDSKTKSEIHYDIEQISNGFILCKRVEGRDSKGNYKCDVTKTFSKENPLDDSVLSKVDKMKQAIGKSDSDGDEVAY